MDCSIIRSIRVHPVFTQDLRSGKDVRVLPVIAIDNNSSPLYSCYYQRCYYQQIEVKRCHAVNPAL